ncbi:Conserved_hypothetical protein [Hexamita inflata]|uniref:TOG domain-containing protein n=1 Tax=Hexamita inflata TaxID=28002 RepID=A0AA86P3D6_9EUKA|nr:Conserved hypothetical protein [Hexamita inflata]CAI9931139.1 Conserved hypothetical protein [Hexamita inflata]
MQNIQDQVDQPQEQIRPSFSDQLLSQQWKERKAALEIVLSNPENLEMQQIFWGMSPLLLKETNIPCLTIILQVVQQNYERIPITHLPQVADVLINQNAQNQKTTIHKMAEDIILKISAHNAKIILDVIMQALESKLSKTVKTVLQLLQLLVLQQKELNQIKMTDFAFALINVLQSTDINIRKSAIEVADLLLTTSEDQQSDLLVIFEQSLPKQIFNQIINQLIAEHVSDDEFTNLLQSKSERITSPVKKPISPQKQQLQQRNQSQNQLGQSRIITEEKVLSYPEPLQMQQLNWKDKKQILDRLAEDFQTPSTSQPSAEFCRQLRLLLDSETNTVCTNSIIKLFGLMAQNIQGFKYIRSSFQGLFTKLKNKQCSQQVQQSLQEFIGPIKLQELVDSDIIPGLQKAETRMEAAIFIRNALYFDQFNKPKIESIIRDLTIFKKLILQLVQVTNDSNLQNRQAAADALAQVIKVHIGGHPYTKDIWSVVGTCFLVDIPQSVGDLIAILQNAQNCTKNTNDYRRMILVVQNVVQELNQYQIQPESDVAQAFGFSQQIQELLNPTVQVQSQQPKRIPTFTDSVDTKTIVQQQQYDERQQLFNDFSRMKSPGVPLKQKINLELEIEQLAQSMKEQSQICDMLLVDHQIDLQLSLQQYVQQVNNLEHDCFENLNSALIQILEYNANQVQIYLDATINFVINNLAQGDQVTFVEGSSILIGLIDKYKNNFHPLSLIKYLDILLFRIQDSDIINSIYDFVSASTKVFGMQIIIYFVQKYEEEHFIIQELTKLLISQINQFQLQGLEYSQNIIYEASSKCNLSNFIFKLLESNIDLDLLNQLVSGICSSLPNAQQFIQQFENNQIFNKIQIDIVQLPLNRVLFPIYKKGIQVPEQKTKKSIPTISSMQNSIVNMNTKSNIDLENEIVNAIQINTKRQIPSVNTAVQQPTIQQQPSVKPKTQQKLTRIYQTEITEEIPNIVVTSKKETPPPDFARMRITVRNQQPSNTLLEYINIYPVLIQDFMDYSNALILANIENSKTIYNLEFEHIRQQCELLCYKLMEALDISDKLLVNCFSSGFLFVASDSSNSEIFLQQLNQLIGANDFFYELVLRYLVYLLIDYLENRQSSSLILSAFSIFKNCKNSHVNLILIQLILRYGAVSMIIEQYQQFESRQIKQLLKQICTNSDPEFFAELENVIYNEIIALIPLQTSRLDLSLISSYIVILNDYISIPSQKFVSATAQFINKQNQSEIMLTMLQLLKKNSQIQAQDLAELPQQMLQELFVYPNVQFGIYAEKFLSTLINDVDTETQITTMKQMILYARDHRQAVHTEIIFRISTKINKILEVYVSTNQSEINFRLLKYAALLHIEMLTDEQSHKHLSVSLLAQTLKLSAYFVLIYGQQHVSDDAIVKLKEVTDNFQLVLQRIQQISPLLQFQTCLLSLSNICNQFLFVHSNTSFDDFEFLNQFQTQMLVKNLLALSNTQIDQLILKRIFCYTAELFSFVFSQYLQAANLQLPSKQQILLMISSQVQTSSAAFDDLLNTISSKTKIVQKEIKLFFRFVRTFCEQYLLLQEDFGYPEYEIMRQAVTEQKGMYQSVIQPAPLQKQKVVQVDQKLVALLKQNIELLKKSPVLTLTTIQSYIKNKPEEDLFNAMNACGFSQKLQEDIIYGLEATKALDNELKSLFG